MTGKGVTECNLVAGERTWSVSYLANLTVINTSSVPACLDSWGVDEWVVCWGTGGLGDVKVS